MEINTSINRIDILKMHCHTFLISRGNLYLFLFFLVIGILFGIPVYEKAKFIFLIASILLFATIGFIGAYIFGVIFSLVIANKENGFIGTHHFVVLEDGFIENTAQTRVFTKWGGVKCKRQTNNVLYLEISNALIHIIPSRAFDNKDEFLEFCKKTLAFIHDNKNIINN